MKNEEWFLAQMRRAPDDGDVRMVYIDWLQDRGDIRASFLLLQPMLPWITPDHVYRTAVEAEVNALRAQIDPQWLAAVGGAGFTVQDDTETTCPCMRPYDERWFSMNIETRYPSASDELLDELYEQQRRDAPEMRLHSGFQDTECAAWKKLSSLIDEAARDRRPELALFRDMSPEEQRKITTLPPSIGKLEHVRRLHLGSSRLRRAPPEIGQMKNLETFTPYGSYLLHWFPYEITHCENLRDSQVSTRALYGNNKYRPPFPRLEPPSDIQQQLAMLSKRYPHIAPTRQCSVCRRLYEDRQQHRVWISLRVATDTLPLLVNACSKDCVDKLPKPPNGYLPHPHRGGKNTE